VILVLTSGLHPDRSSQTCQRSHPRLAAHLGAAKVIHKGKSSLHRRKQPFFDAATQREKFASGLEAHLTQDWLSASSMMPIDWNNQFFLLVASASESHRF